MWFSVAGHRPALSLLASDVGGKLGLCLLMLSFMFWASPKSPTILRGKFAQSLTCTVNCGGPERPLLFCRDPPPSGAPAPPLRSGLLGHHCSASCCPGSEHSRPLRSCPGWGAAVSLQFLVNSALLNSTGETPCFLCSGGPQPQEQTEAIISQILTRDTLKYHPNSLSHTCPVLPFAG